MLKVFFMWENSLNVFCMLFGFFYGVFKCQLVFIIIESLVVFGCVLLLFVSEWLVWMIFMVNEIVFCEWFMLVIVKECFMFDLVGVLILGFLFQVSIGEIVGIVEVQNVVFMEMGVFWGFGVEEVFVCVVMIDCLLEIDEEVFVVKCEVYDCVFCFWDGGCYVYFFQFYYVGLQQFDI